MSGTLSFPWIPSSSTEVSRPQGPTTSVRGESERWEPDPTNSFGSMELRFLEPEQCSSTNPFVFPAARDESVKRRNASALHEQTRWSGYIQRRFEQLTAETPSSPAFTETLNAAWKSILNLFAPNIATPSVLPGDEGGIVLVWHKGGWDIEIDFGPLEGPSVWTVNRSSLDGFDGDLSDHREELLDVLAEISR
jgi:hypothetical protein